MKEAGPNITQKVFDENDLEVFEGDLESRIKALAFWIDHKVKRKQWSNEEIAKKFAKRSTREILTDGDTGFMNPCSDFMLVAWALLKKNGLKPILIAEKIKPKKYNFIHMHFVIEFFNKDILYFLDFTTKNQVVLRKGEYKNQREGIETLQTVKITNDISFDQNMQSVLENNKFDFSGFKLEDIVAQLQKDNTPQTYASYVEKLPHNGDLYLDSDIQIS